MKREYKPAVFLLGHTLFAAGGNKSDKTIETMQVTDDLHSRWTLAADPVLPYGVQNSASVVVPTEPFGTALIIGGHTEETKADKRVLSYTLGGEWIYLNSLT